jgi:hypothetical protein
MTKTLQTRITKLLDRAGDEMSERQAERYFHQVVQAFDEAHFEHLPDTTCRSLARIAGSLQAEYPNFS